MTKEELIKTIFEIVVIGLIFLGLKYEPILSKLEERFFYWILDLFRRKRNNDR